MKTTRNTRLSALALATLAGTAASAQQPQPAPVAPVRHTESVDVTTSIPDGVAMSKFSQPLVDTPQSIVAIPKFVLQDEGVTTLRDALRNVPGISLAAGEAGAQGDNLTIPRLHRTQRHLPRWHPRLRLLLPRFLQL